MGQGVTLVDWDGVGDTISGVEHNTCCTTGGVQGQHGLDSHVHGGGVEGLKHDLKKRKVTTLHSTEIKYRKKAKAGVKETRKTKTV